MPIDDFIRLIWSRRWLFVAVCALCLGATAAVAMLWPRSYVATTRVMLDTGRQRESLNEQPTAAQLSPGYLATQVDVIRSQRVALEAVRMLGIERSEVARRIFVEATGGRGSLEQFFAERLIDRVRIQPSQNSTVIEIGLRAPDARFAADAANAVARAYIATQLELKVQPAREFAAFYDVQARQIRERYEAAQRKLSQYQRTHGIVAADERLDVESTRLNELSSQLVQLQAVRTESAEKAGSASRTRDGSKSLPDVINNPVVAQLRADVARAQARLNELSGQFGPRYPTVERARDELEALEAQLRTQTESVGASLSRQHEVNVARESELRAALDAQRRRVMDLKRQRDDMSVLVRDVESAQRSMEQLSQRLLQNSVESQARGTNAVQLDPAVEPLEPVSPNVPVVVAVGLLLAPMLGMLVACIAGLVDRRALNAGEVGQALGCPVLVEVPRSRRVRRATRPAGLLTLTRRLLPAARPAGDLHA